MKIFLIEDEKGKRFALQRSLENEGHEVFPYTSGEEALLELKRHWPELLVVDVRLPGIDGLEIYRRAKTELSHLQAIFMTAYATVGLAVEAMKLGAYDFLTKPFPAEHLLLKIRRLEELLKTTSELHDLRARESKEGFHGLISSNAKMQRLFDLAKIAAKGDATVLVLGESGVGKELLARAIHAESKRAKEPFLPVAIASFPESLLESELFGYEKGAFTGAVRKHAGRFESVGSGTIFLDDIDVAPLHLQVKLLRVLQEREYFRIGSETPCRFDGRVIAAAKPNLKSLVEKGTFREDLYFRLNVLTLEIPPLRERKEDIPQLANFFMTKYAEKIGKNLQRFDQQALATLLEYSFPGNVRELEHLVERAVYFTQSDTITLHDLPPEICRRNSVISNLDQLKQMLSQLDKEQMPFKGFMETAEQAYLDWALEKSHGNLSEAARWLGIPRTTLRDKLALRRSSEKDAIAK